MDSMISSLSTLSSMQTGLQLSAAMLKKQHDIMQQQGEMVVKLVESTPSPKQGSLGQHLDLWA